MAIASTHIRTAGEAGSITALAAEDGCANHPVIRRVTAPGAAGRDIADAVHALCSVHSRITDLFGEAARRSTALDAQWLAKTSAALAIEHAYLALLTAAVGPLPSTPGQAESDAAFAAQRHTFDMLAKSDRAGCATGAALALVIDWHAFRRILDAAAHRTGIAIVGSHLPAHAEIATIADAGTPAAIRRAMAFGAQQTFAQHRGLCDLIEARAVARDHL